ncbi:MAG: hypothetical protein WCF36_15990 [Candidatus Nanopelagicales bacterium]
MRTEFALVGTALITAGALALPATANAAPVRADVERDAGGRCAATSTWDLGLEKERGRIEVDFEIDSRRSGERWKIKVTHNDRTIFNRTRITDREGEIDVDRDVRNKRGTDRFTVRAVNKGTGEVCRATLRI